MQYRYFYLPKKYLFCSMNVGVGIKIVRVKLGLTQDDVKNRTGITQGYYSMIENGNSQPSEETLQKLSEAFKVPIILFFWLATNKNDFPKKSRHIYDQLKPLMDEIIDQSILK